MRLIKELGPREVTQKNGIKRNYTFAIFECPVCGMEAERKKTDGLKQKRCCGGKSKICKKGSPLHNVYIGMTQRCKDENSEAYKNYGGRGIMICKEWNNFDTFARFCLQNGWTQGKEIDRIKNSEGYNPLNVRFVDRQINQQNKRTNIHSIENIRNIKKDYVTTLITHSELAIKYKDSEGNIGRILAGNSWSNVETEYDKYIESVSKAKKLIRGKVRGWWNKEDRSD